MPSERARSLVAVVVLAALVVLAGCSGGSLGGGGGGGDAAAGESFDADREAADAPEPDGASGGAGGGAGGDGGGDAAASRDGGQSIVDGAIRQRALVKTGSVSLRVEDFETARADLAALARERGGFVAESSQTVHRRGNRTWTTGRLVVRVPSDQFTQVYERVKEAGRVRNAESGTRDVTDELVDLNARLRNLRAERDRLRTLYEEANETEDVLRVGERLSSVQERIERLEARKRALQDRVAYSTITVELAEPEPDPEPTPTPTPAPAYHETGLLTAFAQSVEGVVVTVRTLAVTAAYLLPYLLVFGVPLVGVAAAVIGRRRDLW